MAFNKVFKSQLDIRRERRQYMVAKLLLAGITSINRISQELGVAYASVWKDVQTIRQEWRAEMVSMFDYAKEEQLKRIDKVEEEAWKAWTRSCNIKQKVTETATTSGRLRMKISPPEPTKEGNPYYLTIVRNCCEDRRKLLGLDEPEKIDIRGTIGVANLELQKTIEGNGDYIEYRRQLALSASTGQSVITVLPSNGDQQREVETSQAPYVVGYPSSANGNGKAIITPTKTNRPRPRFD